jgi:hypothetical protein
LLISLPSTVFGRMGFPNVGKVPALGYNTWNSLKCNYNASILLDIAKAMVNLGLRVSLNTRSAVNRSSVYKLCELGSNCGPWLGRWIYLSQYRWLLVISSKDQCGTGRENNNPWREQISAWKRRNSETCRWYSRLGHESWDIWWFWYGHLSGKTRKSGVRGRRCEDFCELENWLWASLSNFDC